MDRNGNHSCGVCGAETSGGMAGFEKHIQEAGHERADYRLTCGILAWMGDTPAEVLIREVRDAGDMEYYN